MKISFLSVINNMELYNKSLESILKLNIPQNIVIKCIHYDSATSMTSGYNKLMELSDSDTDIYVFHHQDVEFLYKDFINDIIECFDKSESIMAIGVAGCVKMPNSQVFWEGPCVGQVLENRGFGENLLKFSNISTEKCYNEVDMVDGLCIISRSKIKFNESIKGFHFYDVSYCRDIINSGYKVVVPYQKETYLLHNIGNKEFDAGKYINSRDIYKNIYNI